MIEMGIEITPFRDFILQYSIEYKNPKCKIDVSTLSTTFVINNGYLLLLNGLTHAFVEKILVYEISFVLKDYFTIKKKHD